MTFQQLFKTATGHEPYPNQCRLACGERSEGQPEPDWLQKTVPCQSRLIDIPTGLGKTAGVVLAWLWNRVVHPSQISNSESEIRAPGRSWPRRLVYCLPMRTLVEQTRDNVALWLENLSTKAPELGIAGPALEELNWLKEHSPIILMGGEELNDARRNWDLHPERPAILIGTQDMLLSRALNRGYGMSRYRWPMHFALLNNDCLWVHDETQLMGVGLETSVQLAGFRERFGTLIRSVHWWMSATLDQSHLQTPEAPSAVAPFHLAHPEQLMEEVTKRLNAKKRLQAAANLSAEDKSYAKALTNELLLRHVSGTLSLVILNTVERAQAVFCQLRKQSSAIPATLLHSRFRPAERAALVQSVLESRGDHIVVSTQVIEAGVDLSARTLFTELAPWSSLVQRFGRCHRHGEMPQGADIFWIDLPDTHAAPYLPEELRAARRLLTGRTDASPAALGAVTPPPAPETPRHIIRPKDLRELFDTTPDIAGADLDISRYIREAEDSDCLVFWRAIAPTSDAESPAREELCPVPVGQLRELAEKNKDKAVWVWDSLAGQWTHPERFIPGRTYWLLSTVGGYDSDIGFDRRSKSPVPTVQLPAPPPQEAHDEDRGTTLARIETLEQHTSAVVNRANDLASALSLPADFHDALKLAAQWHDVGKAHPVFQAALRQANPDLDGTGLYAKSGSNTRLIFEGRPHFRHELASALAFLALAAKSSSHGPLVAYLIAAHHGKVRLSIRSLPGECEPPRPPDSGDPLFARGIWHGDTLPAFDLAGAHWPAVTLSLAPMQIGLGSDGEPSWLESCLLLRDAPDLGPFRLAYLETLLRAADVRASREGLPATKPESHSGVSPGMELREEPPAYGSASILTSAEQSLVADLVADGLSIQDKFRPEPLYMQTGKGHYASDTVEEIRRAREAKSEGGPA